MEAGAAGALYAAENFFTTTAALIKGLTHPTLPLKATFTHITSVPLPRSHHTISIVKGRAYIFGGEEAPGKLANNDMHVIILPSSGVTEADYTSIKPKSTIGGPIPQPRKGHTSVVLGDNIYIFGGEVKDEIDEKGRIWIFQTLLHTWTYLDPAPGTQSPTHRTGHAAASSELPSPRDITFEEKTPQAPADPYEVVPEPAEPNSWGTIFVVGGTDMKTGQALNEALAFNVKSRTWSNIPSLETEYIQGTSISLVGNKLYRFGGKGKEGASNTLYVLDVEAVWKHAEGGTTPLASGWSWIDVSTSPSASLPPPPPSHSSTPHTSTATLTPSPRFATHLIPTTTGQGRYYLILVNGLSPAPSSTTTLLDDVWAYQLPPERHTAASAKDVVREGLKKGGADEGRWAEVRYVYVDGRGDVVGERSADDMRRGVKGIGPREGSAACEGGSEVEGWGVVVWGGRDAGGKVLGDGWVVGFER